MEYSVSVDKNDYDEYLKFVKKNASLGMSASFWKNFVVFMVVGIVLVTIVNLLGLRTQYFHKPTALITVGLFSLLYVFYAAQYRKKRTPDSMGFVFGKRTYILSDEGLREVRPNYESLTRWEAIVKVGETTNQIFLMLDNVAGHIFPTSSLSPGENGALRMFIKSRVANQAL